MHQFSPERILSQGMFSGLNHTEKVDSAFGRLSTALVPLGEIPTSHRLPAGGCAKSGLGGVTAGRPPPWTRYLARAGGRPASQTPVLSVVEGLSRRDLPQAPVGNRQPTRGSGIDFLEIDSAQTGLLI